jgi:hypothetical protein
MRVEPKMTTEVTPPVIPPVTPPRPELPPSKFDTPPPEKQETFTREYVEELRSENKTWRGKMLTERTEREKTAGELEAARNEVKTVKEQAEADAKGKVTEAETRANERVIRAELKTVALKAGMIDLDGLKLADLSVVKINDKGEVVGADALITKLKEAKPYLFGAATSTTNTNTPTPPPNTGEGKKAKDMTPAERDAKLKEIRRAGG